MRGIYYCLLYTSEIDLPEDTELFVTPRDIDTRVRDSARLVGYAIDLALHDALTIEDVDLSLIHIWIARTTMFEYGRLT